MAKPKHHSRSSASPTQAPYTHYAMVGSGVVGYYGGAPPEGATWTCEVGGGPWRQLPAPAPAAAIRSAEAASLFGESDGAA